MASNLNDLKLLAKCVIRSIYVTNSIDPQVLIDDISKQYGERVKPGKIDLVVNHCLPHLLKNEMLFDNGVLTHMGMILATDPNASL